MRRLPCWGVLAALASGGCSLTGTWRVESVEPDSARGAFPLHRVTFNDQGTYADAPPAGKDGESTIGQYNWNPAFYSLHLTPKGATTQSYRGYIRMDRKLVLNRVGNAPEVRAVLVREAHEVNAAP